MTILLKYENQYTKIYDIAQSLAVSSRTIHRELNRIERYVAPFHITLSRVPKKGIQFVGDATHIQQLRTHILEQQTIDLSIEEQKVIMLYALIQSQEPIKQYSLANEIGVSKQTLSKILDDLTADLAKYSLTLQRKRGEGITLEGAESKKRELLSQLMVNNLNSASVYSVIENHFVYQSINKSQLTMVDFDKIFQVERILMDHLDALPYTLTESSYLTLTIHIVLSIDRMKNKEYVDLDSDIYNSVQGTKEYDVAAALAKQLSEMYDVSFTQPEITFITIHLRGAKRKQDTSEPTATSDYDKVHTLVHTVAQNAGTSFNDNQALVNGLLLHLLPAMNRLKSNIETYNPLTEMIQQKYATLFQNVKHSLYTIWPDLKFPDSEIAFVVLHFGGALRHAIDYGMTVLVVCSSGIGTSRLLAHRLESSFPTIQKTVQASVSDLNQLDLSHYDAIISTVNIDIHVPHITVNPLLPEADLDYVQQFLNQQAQQPMSPIDNTTVTPDISTETLLTYMREGLAFIDRAYIDYTDVDDWLTYISDHLYKHECIADMSQFQTLMQDTTRQQNMVLAPYPVAIPHLRSTHITQPCFFITILNTPLAMPINDCKTHDVKYFINMFLPEDTHIQDLASALSATLSMHLETIDTYMSEPEQLIRDVKDAFVTHLKNKLTE